MITIIRLNIKLWHWGWTTLTQKRLFISPRLVTKFFVKYWRWYFWRSPWDQNYSLECNWTCCPHHFPHCRAWDIWYCIVSWPIQLWFPERIWNKIEIFYWLDSSMSKLPCMPTWKLKLYPSKWRSHTRWGFLSPFWLVTILERQRYPNFWSAKLRIDFCFCCQTMKSYAFERRQVNLFLNVLKLWWNQFINVFYTLI